MIGRKQELNLQFQQILDGGLLILSFWLAHIIRSSISLWFPAVYVIPDFNDFKWVLFILMPFGPIVLEMQGFYSHILQKDVWKSTVQLGRAAVVLGLIIALSAFFFRYTFPSRAVLIIFALL